MRPTAFVLVLVVAAVLAGCGGDGGTDTAPPVQSARLTVMPQEGGSRCAPGRQRLRVGTGSAAMMVVTPGASDEPRALLVVLHGSGGTWRNGLVAFHAALDTPSLVVVATSAESRQWNFFYGSDLPTVDRSLAQAFRRCDIDTDRVGVAGFSDGAGAALTLGLANGDLFSDVSAVAPGGYFTGGQTGKPDVLIALGTHDAGNPIPRGRRLVAQLRAKGYDVVFRVFDGGHEVPDAVSREVVRRLLHG
jgi:phospholipase/carboxylesterase